MQFSPFLRLDRLVLATAILAVLVVALAVWHQPLPPLDPQEAEVPDVIYLRPWVKEGLAREVAAGRRSLFEAAALFGALDRAPPEHPDVSPLGLDEMGRFANERQCERVIVWVEYALGENHPDQAATVARLRTDLRHALERDGGLQLPDPATLDPLEQLFADARQQMATAIRLGHRQPRDRGVKSGEGPPKE